MCVGSTEGLLGRLTRDFRLDPSDKSLEMRKLRNLDWFISLPVKEIKGRKNLKHNR